MKPGDVVIGKHTLLPYTILDVIDAPNQPTLLILEGWPVKENAEEYMLIEEVIEKLEALSRVITRDPKPALVYHKKELENLTNLPPNYLRDQDKEIERRTQIIKELEK